MIKKIISIIFFLLLQLLFVVKPVRAAEEFETSFITTYDIDASGISTVSQNIQLTNKLSNVYATQYALEIGSNRIDQVDAFDSDGREVNTRITTTENKTVIVANFDDKTVGKGQTLDFTVKYRNLDVAQKSGSVLEINIPKLSQEADIDKYQVILNIPILFGEPKIVSPGDFTKVQSRNVNRFTFSSQGIKESGVTAIFGQHQVFNFSLTYNLENPTVSNAVTQVALPPDTPYQQVFYEDINPPPDEIVLDEDGNWIATFSLEPKQRVSALAQGSVVLYMDPVVPVPSNSDLESYLQSQKFWETNHQEVIEIAQRLKTPENIYNYLVNNFSYNYDRINSGIERLGVVDALAHKDNAICTEFTDSFIAIARAAGIPARELNGYAHTQNSVLKPLSLVQDVLHAWPEYYDPNTKTWRPVDPTWGNTTGGVDYFNNLDFNHFVFAIHGSDSQRPYPAGYYKFENVDSKDLDITFGSAEPELNTDLQVSFQEKRLNPFTKNTTIVATITSQGNAAVYNLPITFTAHNATINQDSIEVIDYLLPFSSKEIEVKLTPSSQSSLITLSANNQDYDYQIKNNITSSLVIGVSVILGIGIAFIAFRAWRLLVSKRKK